MKDAKRLANFLFEVGTMRKLLRIHRQTLLSDDISDNIASHSYRVAIIAWVIAKEEKADLYKTLLMALLHDLDEVRSNDHNYVQKRYVKIYKDEIRKEQFGTLPFSDFKELADEYEERNSLESKIVKDADLMDQILLLREYEWQGNREAVIWLYGKGKETENAQVKNLSLQSSKKLAKAIYEVAPSEWWEDIWTNKNR